MAELEYFFSFGRKEPDGVGDVVPDLDPVVAGVVSLHVGEFHGIGDMLPAAHFLSQPVDEYLFRFPEDLFVQGNVGGYAGAVIPEFDEDELGQVFGRFGAVRLFRQVREYFFPIFFEDMLKCPVVPGL